MFWFRNLSPYRFTEDCPDLLDGLEEALEPHRLGECPSHSPEALGWITPVPGDERLAYGSQDLVMLSLGHLQRMLPASVVNDAVQEHCDHVEATEARHIGGKERKELKEQITQELLPRAFVRRSHTRLIIAPRLNALWIDSANARRCDAALSLLRQCTPSLPVAPLVPVRSPMDDWVRDMPLPNWELGDAAVLQDDNDGSVVRLRKHALDADEVRQHLQAGKTVQRLALDWRERLQFQLDQSLVLYGLKYADALLDQLEDDTDARAIADAELALMRGEFNALQAEIQSIFC